jgi:hypothetical protein
MENENFTHSLCVHGFGIDIAGGNLLKSSKGPRISKEKKTSVVRIFLILCMQLLSL